MNYRKIVAVISMTISVTGTAAVEGCDATGSDREAVVVCNPPKGYVKAGRAARAGKGQFYFCVKNARPCVITYRLPDNANGKAVVINKKLQDSGLSNVPKNATSWKVENCGGIYKKAVR